MSHSRKRIVLPAEQAQDLARAIEAGDTIKATANAAGMRPDTLVRVLRRQGFGAVVEQAGTRAKAERLAMLHEQQGVEVPGPIEPIAATIEHGLMSAKKWAEHLGVATDTLYRRLRAAGLPTRATAGGGR